MNSSVLTICIPTFNRKDVLLSEVQDYLSVTDSRFRVVVQDNCSSDGTQEDLEVIKDERLVYRRNLSNFGSIVNWIKSLSGNSSEYLLFTLDKDLVDINKLPAFIDYLEREKPNFGYVDLSNDKPFQVLNIPKGLEAIKQTAYLSKHPSGYFWKRNLFEDEICQSYFKDINPKFDFPFEVINAHLSVKYDATIVIMPLIINANMRKLTGKTLTYNESNIFYSCSKRLEAFQLYLSDFLTLGLPLREKKIFAAVLLKRTFSQVTVELKRLLRHKSLCEHYNLTPRVVSTKEMFQNMEQTLKLFKQIAMSEFRRTTILKLSVMYFFRNCLAVCKWEFIELFIKPKDFEIRC